MFVFTNTVFGQSNWTLKKDEKGVKVYTASVPESKVKTFKAVSIYKHSAEELVAAILDYENYPKWIDGVEKGRLIERISQNEFVIRQIVLLPFPFDNRESVQRIEVKNEPDGSILIKISEANEMAPALDGYVRMTITHGYWLIQPTAEGTKLTYSFIADPGENIPAWLINSFIVSQPYNSLRQLRGYLAEN
jgi:hypothetical protein